MKLTGTILYLSSTILALLLFLSPHVHAADNEYKLLVPLSNNQTTIPDASNGLTRYLQTIISMTIGLAGISSVIMLIIGGLEYIFSSVNEKTKNDAKDRITNALLGLLIVLSGYLILKTINPNLLNLKLPEIKPLKLQGTPPNSSFDGDGGSGGEW